MAVYPARVEHVLDLTQVDAVARSQRWVLTAMQHHGAALVGMLWRILGNEQDVCDAYQETFLRLAILSKQPVGISDAVLSIPSSWMV